MSHDSARNQGMKSVIDMGRDYLLVGARVATLFSYNARMAEALRIRTLVAGKTLTLSDMDRFVGKRVEVIVREDESAASATPRTLGTLKGQITIADDFDAPLPGEIQQFFEGEDP